MQPIDKPTDVDIPPIRLYNLSSNYWRRFNG